MFSESKNIQGVCSEDDDDLVERRACSSSTRISLGCWIHHVKSVQGFATQQPLTSFLSLHGLHRYHLPVWRGSWTLEAYWCRETEREIEREREEFDESSAVKNRWIFEGVLSTVSTVPTVEEENNNNVKAEKRQLLCFHVLDFVCFIL